MVKIYRGRNVDNKVDDKVTNTVKFSTFEPFTSTERLSTVSSPFLSNYNGLTIGLNGIHPRGDLMDRIPPEQPQTNLAGPKPIPTLEDAYELIMDKFTGINCFIQ